MTWNELLESIPPEMMTAIIAAIAALVSAVIGFIVWLIRFLPKLIETRVKQGEKEALQKVESVKSKWELERLEIQNQLDQTQNGREMIRLQAAAAQETQSAMLKIFEALREDAKTRDIQNSKFLAEIVESSKSLTINAATTLELLKSHKEHDEAVEISMASVRKENGETHKKLYDASVKLDTANRALIQLSERLTNITQSIESILSDNVSDRRLIESVQVKLETVSNTLVQVEAMLTKNAAQSVPEKTQPLDSEELSKLEEKENKE